MIRTVTGIHSRRGKERPLTSRMVAVACALYCPTGLAVGFIDQRFLLMAWVMVGFLGLSLYLTIDRRMPLANTGTLFFASSVLACIGGFALGN